MEKEKKGGGPGPGPPLQEDDGQVGPPPHHGQQPAGTENPSGKGYKMCPSVDVAENKKKEKPTGKNTSSRPTIFGGEAVYYETLAASQHSEIPENLEFSMDNGLQSFCDAAKNETLIGLARSMIPSSTPQTSRNQSFASGSINSIRSRSPLGDFKAMKSKLFSDSESDSETNLDFPVGEIIEPALTSGTGKIDDLSKNYVMVRDNIIRHKIDGTRRTLNEIQLGMWKTAEAIEKRKTDAQRKKDIRERQRERQRQNREKGRQDKRQSDTDNEKERVRGRNPQTQKRLASVTTPPGIPQTKMTKTDGQSDKKTDTETEEKGRGNRGSAGA